MKPRSGSAGSVPRAVPPSSWSSRERPTWGSWYPNVRVYRADADAGAGFTWIAGLRRYFAGTSFVWASVGRGARSLETGTAEEILAGPAWLVEAGFDVTAFRGVRLRGYVSRREGIGGADSTALALVAGYRF